jgi:hypothetical protein
MEFFRETNTQISPCIAAKAKFALNITSKKPKNKKKCSYEYWCKVIQTFATQKNIYAATSEHAKNQYKNLIK